MDLSSQLEADWRGVTDRFDKNAVEAAEYLADQIRAVCPERTGRLLSGIGVEGTEVVSDAPYSAFVDAKRPFFMTTIDANQAAVESIMYGDL